jgi:hypothetical protein
MREEPEVIRWPEDEAPTEPAIRGIMADEGLRPYRWSNAPGTVYGGHTHAYHKVLYVLSREGRRVTLGAGDRLELPAHTWHDARVGLEGVVCLEAQKSRPLP